MRVAGVITAEAGGKAEPVDDLEIDEPRAGEALVRIAAAGVCGSDLALLGGKMPYPMPLVLGHEAAGEVEALGPGTDGPAPGTRVVLWMRPPCRQCRSCLRGDAGLCERSGTMSAKGTLLDGRTGVTRDGAPVYRAFGVGAFATHVVMPVAGLVPVPDDTPLDVAALLGCGVATGAGAVLNVAQPSPGDTVLIFGAGGVGLAAAMAASAIGAGAVVVVDPSEERRRQALTFGATHVCEPGDRKVLRGRLAELLGDTPVDVAIDAVGRPELVETGYRTVRQGGMVVAVGLQPADAQISLPASMVALSHKQIAGCFMGGIDPQRDLPMLFALHRRGALPIDRLVTARRPLDETPIALDDLANARGLRTVIEMAE